MEMTFLKAVAIFGAIIFGFNFIYTVYNALTYDKSATYWADRMQGLRRTFKPGKPFVVCAVCILYVIYGG